MPSRMIRKSRAKSAAPVADPRSALSLPALRRRLIAWYRKSARDLPWRHTRDPYSIWISETMLQQTQVATVIPYYERFLSSFPTVTALAAATEAQVLRHWEGLGYYRRARQLHAAAKIVAAEYGGIFPRSLEEIRRLPGIGRYTAGAIMSFAYDKPAPIVEANTLRVYCRMLAFAGDPRSTVGQRLLWETAEQWLPRQNAGEFNQAVMELGSTVCKIRDPHCAECPLRLMCPTRAHGLQESIPAPPKPPNFESLNEAAIVVRKDQRVLLVLRGPAERWAGLWDFPRFSVLASKGAALQRELQDKLREATGVEAQLGNQLAIFKHGVTRFRISLACFEAKALSSRKRLPQLSCPSAANEPRSPFSIPAEIRWVKLGELEQYALPVTGRKLAKMLA